MKVELIGFKSRYQTKRSFSTICTLIKSFHDRINRHVYHKENSNVSQK